VPLDHPVQKELRLTNATPTPQLTESAGHSRKVEPALPYGDAAHPAFPGKARRTDRCFDEFLERRFPGSRRKAYYLMSIHEHSPPQARK
jgi:hypothetical protein